MMNTMRPSSFLFVIDVHGIFHWVIIYPDQIRVTYQYDGQGKEQKNATSTEFAAQRRDRLTICRNDVRTITRIRHDCLVQRLQSGVQEKATTLHSSNNKQKREYTSMACFEKGDCPRSLFLLMNTTTTPTTMRAVKIAASTWTAVEGGIRVSPNVLPSQLH